MSAVCRVCLAGNTTLHSLINTLLIDVYEILSNTKFNCEDARPRVICHSCYQKLLRCHTFSQMAHRSEKIFDQIYDKGLETTHEYITEMNLEMNQLSVTTQQVDTIDGNATDASSQVTIKDEPVPSIDIKEEVTTEQDKLEQVWSVAEDCTESQLTLEDKCDRENGEGELPSYNHVTQTKDDSKITLCCNNCNKIFFHESKLISHIRNSHSQIEGNRINNLVENMKNHKGEKPFACNVCDKQFILKSNLTTHLKTHTGERPFACSVCDKQFKQNIHLVVHMRTHTGEKPFACHVCYKQFKSNSNLVAHTRTHTGEKPFACSVCDKRYSRKEYLVSHVRIHTEENPCTGHVCEKQFKQNIHLFSRMKTHIEEKPFACQVCAKQFKQNKNLVVHMRTHTGEKPFACHVCYKQFKSSSNLAAHTRTHTGEKPFACSVCDKRFNQKEYLFKHVRIHTGEKPCTCQV